MKYYHVDVFSPAPCAGNGLTVVLPESDLSRKKMLEITREFRQFETIFVFPEKNGSYPVRIFTVEEELNFAGHPLLGAAAVIHSVRRTGDNRSVIYLAAGSRKIELNVQAFKNHFRVTMNQGRPGFISSPSADDVSEIIQALGLSGKDIFTDYPLEVVSTGLPYLLVPLCGIPGLEKAGINTSNFEKLLGDVSAKFVYVFDPDTLECRTWDNAGLVEDVATGSAAGPLSGYLVKNGYRKADEKILIRQGRFTGRPSLITAQVSGSTGEIFIEGDVAFFGRGELFL